MLRRIFMVGIFIISIFGFSINSLASGVSIAPVYQSSDDLYNLWINYSNLSTDGTSTKRIYNWEMSGDDAKSIMLNNKTKTFYVILYEDSTAGKRALVFSTYSGEIEIEANEDNHYLYVRSTTDDGIIRHLAGGALQDTSAGLRLYGNYVDDSVTVWKAQLPDMENYPSEPPPDTSEPPPDTSEPITSPSTEEYDGWFGGVVNAITGMLEWMKTNLNPVNWFNALGEKMNYWFVPSPEYAGHTGMLETLKAKIPFFFIIYDGFKSFSSVDHGSYQVQVHYQNQPLIPYKFLNGSFTSFLGTYTYIDFIKKILTVSLWLFFSGWLINTFRPKLQQG